MGDAMSSITRQDMGPNWAATAAAALAATSADTKVTLTLGLPDQWRGEDLQQAIVPPSPGWPPTLSLAQPTAVPRRSTGERGRAHLLHAIAHIEFSAIQLALDHALRFPGLPSAYYGDWLNVAAEEASHFDLVRQRLRSLGCDYGDFPVHDSLWRMAERSAHDVLVRMALVPRLMEARGLDATPEIRQRLASAGDRDSALVLDRILADEIGHVGLGDKWFRHFCGLRQLPPDATYRKLIREYNAPWPRMPMNTAARRAAGFSDEELAALAGSGPDSPAGAGK